MNSVFVKSKLCNYFQALGACTNGDACTFAHGEEEIGQPHEGKQRTGSGGKDLMGSGGMVFMKFKLCTYFMQMGSCTNGGACRFAHGDHELNQPIIQSEAAPVARVKSAPVVGGGVRVPSRPAAVQPGAIVASGAGHSKFKLCTYFMSTGFCTNGNECRFAHGEHQLGQGQTCTVAQAAPVAFHKAPAGGQGHTKFKLCNYFMTIGTCTNEHNCRFAHGEHQLGEVIGGPSTPDPAAYVGGGQLHTKFKLCNSFMSTGTCFNGNNCRFAHGEHQFGDVIGGPSKPAAAARIGGGQVHTKFKLCNSFASSGFCTKGEACTFAHGEHELGEVVGGPSASAPAGKGGSGQVYTKFKLCNYFETTGSCTNGDDCKFAHGAEQLGEVIQKGGTTVAKGAGKGGKEKLMLTAPRQPGMAKFQSAKGKAILASIPDEQKVWVGGLTTRVDHDVLKKHFESVVNTKWVEILGPTEACVAFNSAEEAETAVLSLDGLPTGVSLDGQALQLVLWGAQDECGYV